MSAKRSINDEVTIQLIKDLYMFFCVESKKKTVEVEALYYYFVKYKDNQISEWIDEWDYNGNVDDKAKMRKVQRVVKLFTEGDFLGWLYKKKRTRQTFLQLVLHTYPDPSLFYPELRKGTEPHINYVDWDAKRLYDYYSENVLIIHLSECSWFKENIRYKKEEYRQAIETYKKNSVHKMSGYQLSELIIKRPSKRKVGKKFTVGEYLFEYRPINKKRGKVHTEVVVMPDFFGKYYSYFYKERIYKNFSVSGLAWVKCVIGDPYIKDKECKKQYTSMTNGMMRTENIYNERNENDNIILKTFIRKKHVLVNIKGHVFRLSNSVINAYIARKLKK